MNKWVKIIPLLFCFFLCISGCGTKATISQDSFASMYFNTSDTMHCYKALNGKTHILDYESMEDSLLCNKPNCTHVGNDCIVARLGGNIPMFSGTNAYYFVDDSPMIEEGADGKPFLKLGSTLYRFDLTTYTEEKILYVEGVSVSNNCYGWLLHDGTIWFIGNHYNPETDENGILTTYRNTGGKMDLYSVNLSTRAIQNYSDLYDVPNLTKHYPLTDKSGEVYMKGMFDSRIYFQVSFVTELEDKVPNYVHYVEYFDLDSKKLVGEPVDFDNIDYCTVAFISKDYMIITRDGQADIYRAGQDDPVTVHDEKIFAVSFFSVSAFDEKLFVYDHVYDLNTQACTALQGRENTVVIAAYQDSYIISNAGGQDEFEKIPKTAYLAG